MAHVSQLPCNGDGTCMICKKNPSPDDTFTCRTCATPWHVTCLSSSSCPQTLADALLWDCPDCSLADHPHLPLPPSIAGKIGGSDKLVVAIRAIESDDSLNELEKARRRQELVSGGGARLSDDDGENVKNKEGINGDNDVLAILDGNINCSICMQLPERPVTTPCGHNFCLKCFQKWVAQGKRTCANCRNQIPSTVASQPRINSALVIAIRMAKMEKSNITGGAPKVYHFVHNQNRPDKAYTTERAKKPGKANACSGKIFVTVPPDHFGPILAENDPQRKQGVLVGETWQDRMECRQWGAHLPHVAGIAGQSKYGAQSVALSGGYIDDEDHGEWFLYTGSGGRDLSGNKRTNKAQSFDQKFEKLNEALRLSCRKGYPVRVVRSHKEKRSSYAPEAGVRYDGVYRIEKCWRKNGIQGYKVCRYLFVRCDNDPAPWTSDIHGDQPRPLPAIKELKNAIDITERKGSPSWDYDEVEGCWMWKNPPPCSRKQMNDGNIVSGKKRRRAKRTLSAREKLLKEFSCQICRDVMTSPLTTPCAHNFCKACLEGAFAGQSFTRQRTCEGRRTLRAQKNIMKCPSCSNDLAEFLQNPQVNRELMTVIESLQHRNVGEEQSDESSKEVDSRHEETDAAADDIEMSSANNHNNLKSGMEVKPQRTDKFKSASARNGNSSCQARPLLEPPDVEQGTKGGSVKPENRGQQTSAAERKLKQTKKRKKSSNATSNVGVTTRSKRAKLTTR
ncbi:E3 ubiquitin-protein ligase ORTHRUS 2-like [Durio zibethinus]|uniref:RING-type E3 ubiquitin transferase n=1 Tax=Durio zibethinus TaxID=66656 RepID=A0A6P6AGY0_DURZI|nr:E3 ubiquitin-protein ligase ORTHRUS 2-like [Durio zibethinus]